MSSNTVTIELAEIIDESTYGAMANFIRKNSTEDNEIFKKGGSEMVKEYNEKRKDDAVGEVVPTKPFKLAKTMEDVYHYSFTFSTRKRLTRTNEFMLRVGVWKFLMLAKHHKVVAFNFTTPKLFGNKPETCSKVIIQTILLFLEQYPDDKKIAKIVLFFQEKPHFFLENYIMRSESITLRQTDLAAIRKRTENGGFEIKSFGLNTPIVFKSFVKSWIGPKNQEKRSLRRLAMECGLSATTK